MCLQLLTSVGHFDSQADAVITQLGGLLVCCYRKAPGVGAGAGAGKPNYNEPPVASFVCLRAPGDESHDYNAQQGRASECKRLKGGVNRGSQKAAGQRNTCIPSPPLGPQHPPPNSLDGRQKISGQSRRNARFRLIAPLVLQFNNLKGTASHLPGGMACCLGSHTSRRCTIYQCRRILPSSKYIYILLLSV